MDVKNAFLNGDLEKEIYMKQPIRRIDKGWQDKVYKLNKFIYRLKQSVGQWYIIFQDAINSNDFQMCFEDHFTLSDETSICNTLIVC